MENKTVSRKRILAVTLVIELIAVICLGMYIYNAAEVSAATNSSSASISAAAQKKADAAAVEKLYTDSDSALVRNAVKYIGNVGGEKFWSWYGYSYHVAWCGCFVSYCADETGYLGTKIPRFSYVPTGVSWFMSEGMFKYPSEYTPKAGDIIFYRSEGSTGTDANSGSHVGIVAGVYKGRVYTVEGNHYDKCSKNSYSLKSARILGYGVVNG